MWNLPPPPGFQGLREDLPLHVYTRRMPHWRQDGATYFVTFRLADSLPQAKLRELEEVRLEWEKKNPRPHGSDNLQHLARLLAERTEAWLDQGMGSCILKESALAAMVTDAMHFFDGDRHEISAYVVMPNHVHAIVRPLQWAQHPLESILKSWKQCSSTTINQRIGCKGPLWQQESYDRIVRDEEHLYRCLQYIGCNPKKAGLLPNSCPRWLRPEWVTLGWTIDEVQPTTSLPSVGRAS
jgi:REP element-mobilizing transposase RayT